MRQLFNKQYSYYFLLLVTLFINSAHALDLKQAEALSIQADPLIEGFRATSDSYISASFADNTLPDPTIHLGAVNVPVDTFDFEQEQMTQIKLGIQQKFARGDSLAIKQQQSQLMSSSSLAMADDARLHILRDVRIAFLNLFYEVEAYQIVRETRQLFSELVKVTQSNYASGRGTQQDVVMANLELSRLDDRSTKIQSNEESYRAELAQWIGDIAWNEISRVFPVLPSFSENIDLNVLIPQHPLIRSATATVSANKKMSEIARQRYKPEWGVAFDYGYRSGNNPDGTARADFASALVTLDVPLFTNNRQDKIVASNKHKIRASRYLRDDQLRQLKNYYETNLHRWERLGDREELYKNSLLKAAEDNAASALKSYQSGVTEFDTLMRAEITELDVRLEELRVRVDRVIAHARLLYVTGDNDNEI